ncbi:MAG: ABC transporter permease, partial [Bacteroidota bacterium]
MLEVIKFELKYRLARPATYIYFFLMFLISFLATATDLIQAGGGGGKVMDNAPVQIAIMMMLMMWFGLLICSAIMGVPVLRDYEHNTSAIIFSTPIKKREYLGGRFIGSFIILLLVISGVLLGMMLGLSTSWPWQDQPHKLLPFNLWHFIHPFLVFILPGLFFFGSLFFAAGALGKRMIVVYAQAIIAFMGYLISTALLGQLDNRTIAAMIDPVGIGAYSVITQYWTVVEQNSQVIPLEGVVLYNRLLWLAIGILALVITFWKFSFDSNPSKKTKKAAKVSEEKNEEVTIPTVNPQYGWTTSLQQVLDLSLFYFKWIFKQVPFKFIVLAGIIFVFIIGFLPGQAAYDIDTYATSASIAATLNGSFGLFFFILLVFYSGELIWKERDVKINLIYDAMPYRDYVSLLGKYLGYQLVQIALVILLIGCGVIIQLLKGGTEIELGVYFAYMFGNVYTNMAMFSLMAFFLQIMVNQKFLGFAAMVIFFVSLQVIGNLGIEHNLLIFGSGGLGRFSEMNEFGHYFAPFSWFNIYWFAFIMMLFVVAVVFSVRGSEAIMKTRLKVGLLRLTRPLLTFGIFAMILFTSSGFYIYYNTNVVNEYTNSDDEKKLSAEYEEKLKRYESMVQPKIVDTKVNVDIFPMDRDFNAKGYYILRNKSDQPINEIYIQNRIGDDFTNIVKIAGKEADESFDQFGFEIFKLPEPMLPGQELKLDFEVIFETNGFQEGRSDNSVIYNGTFFNNFYFPTIGYDRDYELRDDDDRLEYGMQPVERMMERDDPRGIAQSLFGDDADKITFEITVGTDSSQIAIAPGYLIKKWNEGARSYFNYKMDVPMVNFYSIVSAKYEVKKDVWKAPADSMNDVSLEIYYHKGHEYNLDRMMEGMKKSLDYNTKNFSPYQFRQLRIMEFPAYASFAQSFANTIPFSEAIGFVHKITEDDVDLPFYVTAHEVAHQWWGHQVTEAGVKGNAMLSEALAQYTALMVMKQNYPEEQISRYLKYELNSYLLGRTFERKKEMPIEFVEGQAGDFVAPRQAVISESFAYKLGIRGRALDGYI